MKNWLATVGSNASYKSVASSIGQAVNTGAAAVKAAVKEERAVAHPDRHHVRLSLESAKRLTWIESEDVSALVRRHAQEKNLLGECVSAMRKFLLQKGFQEDAIDAEVQALLNEAREIDINDQDVATVLLVSVQDELNEMRARLATLQPHFNKGATMMHGPHASAPFRDMHAAGGASSSNASYTTLPMPPTPPDSTATRIGLTAAAPAGAAMHGGLSPRASEPYADSAAVQVLLTVQSAEGTAEEGIETVKCSIVPVPQKLPEGSGASAQSAMAPYAAIMQQANNLQELLSQQHAIYSELLALKPAIMSAQIAANNSFHTSTPFEPSFTPAPGNLADSASLDSRGVLTFATSPAAGNVSESLPDGSPSKRSLPQMAAHCSPLQAEPVDANSVVEMRLQGDSNSTASPPVATPTPSRAELANAVSVDSGISELKFGSPRTCAQATADLHPMLARLGELEHQRRLCLEATTDASTALLAAASNAATAACVAPVATPGNSRVRELEGQVAQLRNALRRATSDGVTDAAAGGVRSPRSGGSPCKSDVASSGDRQGGGEKKGSDKGALAAAQVQLRMARQLVLSEQDRATHAEKRAERLEGRCKKLQAEADSAAAKAKAAEARAADASSDATARTSDAAAERDAQAATQRAALHAAQRNAAQAASAAQAAERREAAALAQVAALELVAEEKGQLEAKVAALQGRVDDASSERSRADHFREISEALEAKVASHMHESVQAAQAAADADARAAAAHDAMMAALREQHAAEARAAQLEKRIRDEVVGRLRAIGSDRSLWPQEAREALEASEREAAAAQERVRTLEKDIHVLHAQNACHQASRQQASAQQQDVATSDFHVEALRAEAQRAQARLEKQLERLEKELSSCQDAKRRLEAELVMSMHASSAANPILGVPGAIINTPATRTSSGAYWGQGLLPGLQPPSPESHTPTRSPRVSNITPSTSMNLNGFGVAAADVSISLDNVHRASKLTAGGATARKPSQKGGSHQSNLDVPYLRNLLMKLLEAISAGKASERDALLPVVGMLVGATPVECDSLKNLFVSKTLW